MKKCMCLWMLFLSGALVVPSVGLAGTQLSAFPKEATMVVRGIEYSGTFVYQSGEPLALRASMPGTMISYSIQNVRVCSPDPERTLFYIHEYAPGVLEVCFNAFEMSYDADLVVVTTAGTLYYRLLVIQS